MLRSRVHALLVGAVLLGAVALSVAPTVAGPFCQGGVEVAGPGPVKFCAGEGEVILSICIKAGTSTWQPTEDGKYGCYDVKGIGTDCVEVTGGGTGRDCKEISGVRFYVEKKK